MTGSNKKKFFSNIEVQLFVTDERRAIKLQYNFMSE
jgi:hypothetical protein